MNGFEEEEILIDTAAIHTPLSVRSKTPRIDLYHYTDTVYEMCNCIKVVRQYADAETNQRNYNRTYCMKENINSSKWSKLLVRKLIRIYEMGFFSVRNDGHCPKGNFFLLLLRNMIRFGENIIKKKA